VSGALGLRGAGGGMSRVLVVDDEDRVRDVLRRTLVNEGHTVVEARDGTAALDAVTDDIDLVLLDLVMPGINGIQVLEALAARATSVPVMVLSGVGQVSARVQALDLGAVDFVTKPFHPAELVARARRHLVRVPRPRSEPAASDRYLSAGGVRLDLERRRARSADNQTEVVLSEREFALLAHLMRRRGSVCRRDELLHDVWGLDFDPGSNVVEVAVRRLRNHLDDPPIETVRGVGYCFVGA
jgi:DNA-binding response OmpR family regulator